MFKTKNLHFYIFLAGCYLFSRLINLGIIPIFTDEAIYSYWAQVALHDPANRYISLVDGKQPLFIWISAVFQKFISDPLIATRMTSVFSGGLSVIGIYILSKELFSEKVAKIASLIYIILPFTLLYDRMALYDSLLTMLGIYSVYFSVKMVKNPRLDIALLNGITIGLALLTKSSGYFYIYYIPVALLLLDIKSKNLKPKIIKWLSLSAVTFILAQIIYNTLRLSPYFYIISQKNLSFIRPVSEVIQTPFQNFDSNIVSLASWLSSYIGLPLFLLVIAGTIYFLLKKNLKVLTLTSLILIPFVAEGIFNKVLYPRFILFYFPYIIVIAAATIIKIKESKLKYQNYINLSLPLFFLIPAINSLLLLTYPAQAQIADSDRGQYLNDWPAGYGVKESVDLIKNTKNTHPVYVATEGTFGLLPYALNIYFFGEKNVEINGFWPVDPNNIPQQVLDASKSRKTYFIFNENQKDITSPRLKFISKFQKGTGNSFLRIYEVLPK